MFYSVQILSKGGPLQIIWLAAHMDRQLKRQQIFETSIPFSVDAIIKPQGAPGNEAPLALRLTGQLLLGVVKVYARKVAYLAQDCDHTLQKINTIGTRYQPEHSDAAASTLPTDKHHRKAGAHSTASMLGTDPSGDAWPASDEDVFASPASRFQALNSTPAGRSGGLLPSLRPADSTLRTPPVAHRLLPDAETPLAVRKLSFAHAGHEPVDLDDMFEAVPEQFEFDLNELEFNELAAGGTVPFSSQQLSTLDSTLPLVEVDIDAEEQAKASGAKHRKTPAAGAADKRTKAAPANKNKGGAAPARVGSQHDEYLFEGDAELALDKQDHPTPGDHSPDHRHSPDQAATLQYQGVTQDGQGDEADGATGAGAGSRAGSGDLAATAADGGGALPDSLVDEVAMPAAAPRLTRAQAAAAMAAAAAGASPAAAATAAAAATPASQNKRSATDAGLPEPAAVGRGARRAATASAEAAPVAEAVAPTTPAPAAPKPRVGRKASALQQQAQRAKMPAAHHKAAVDDDSTTLSNAEYRSYLSDRSRLLRDSPAPAPKPVLGALGAAAQEQEVQLFFSLPGWAHSALQALCGQALGSNKGAAAAGPLAVLQKQQALVLTGPQNGVAGALPDEDEDAGLDGKGLANGGLPQQQDGAIAGHEGDVPMLDAGEAGSGVEAAGSETRPRDDVEAEVPVEDPFQGDYVDIFEASRRPLEDESESMSAARQAARNAGLTSRTKALLRQVEDAARASQRAAKRQRQEVPSQESPAAAAAACQEPDAADGQVLLSQLLPSSKTRHASAFGMQQRHRAAQMFYDLLVLQNRGLVQLQQAAPYQDVMVVPAAVQV